MPKEHEVDVAQGKAYSFPLLLLMLGVFVHVQKCVMFNADRLVSTDRVQKETGFASPGS
jgi:hypothetical protein